MLKRIATFTVRLYQYGVSPLTPAACRYAPTCSEYARRAIERFGVARGLWLAVRRLLRCQPFGGRGYDPVPPAGTASGEDAGADAGRPAGPEGPGPGRASGGRKRNCVHG